jgi:hypothetical protein
MYLQEILEIAIGLVFVWFVISMFAMTIQEWIASLLNFRAKYLESTLLRMLDDPDYESGIGVKWRKLWSKAARNSKMIDFENSFTKSFYNHRLIRVLSMPHKRPSYVSVGKFADVIFDMLLTAGTDASILQSALSKANENLNLLVASDQQTAAKESLTAMLDFANHVIQTDGGVEAVEELRKKVDLFTQSYPAIKPLIDTMLTFPPPDRPISITLQRMAHGIFIIGAQNEQLKESLAPLILDAEKYLVDKEQALAKARQNIETWFNESMDRVSGVYKRKAQVIAFFIGVALALLVNLDSVAIAESLWKEPTLRQTLVAKAELEVAQAKASGQPIQAANSSNPVADLQEKLKDLNLPLGWTVFPKDDPTVSLCKWNPTANQDDNDRFGFLLPSIQSIDDVKAVFNRTASMVCYSPAQNANSTNGLKWLLGILVTGGAAAQGAPFWFEVLGKLVNVRSAGVKPDDPRQKKG